MTMTVDPVAMVPISLPFRHHGPMGAEVPSATAIGGRAPDRLRPGAGGAWHLAASMVLVLRRFAGTSAFGLRIANGGRIRPVAATGPDDPERLAIDLEHRWTAAEPAGPAMAGDVVLCLDDTAIPMAAGLRCTVSGGDVVWRLDGIGLPDGLLATIADAHGRLLAWMAAPDRAATAPPDLLPPADRRLIEDANDTAAPLPDGLLHDAVLARAAEAPERPAVIAAGHRLTRAGLATRSARLRDRLLAQGIAPGAMVAVVMDKGWEQVVAVLAILRAAAIYLPVDAGMPADRLAHILAEGGVTTALTTAAVAAGTTWPAGLRIIAVDAETAGLPDDPGAAAITADRRAGPDDLAYVIYTSGSTGRPKGVMIEHRAALNTLADINRRLQVSEADSVLGVSALSFDLSVYDIFGVLGAGGTLVLPDAGRGGDARHWLDLLRTHRVTLWNAAPMLFELLIDRLERDPVPPPPLRHAMMSGDWIPVTLPARAQAVMPDCRSWSLGGATEVSVWSVMRPIDAVDPAWPSIPYGRPLANQTVHVLDDAFRPCPVHVTGGLYIGGVGLARGYVADPERTAASFVTDPLTGARLYRTGDLCRWLPSGELEFLGRVDQQLKLRGFRIEPGEIEAVLREHDGVADAVVAAAGEGRDRRLVAFVLPAAAGETAPDPMELRAHLAARLPRYMLPDLFYPITALPLTANGKADRRRLVQMLDEATTTITGVIDDILALSDDEAAALLQTAGDAQTEARS